MRVGWFNVIQVSVGTHTIHPSITVTMSHNNNCLSNKKFLLAGVSFFCFRDLFSFGKINWKSFREFPNSILCRSRASLFYTRKIRSKMSGFFLPRPDLGDFFNTSLWPYIIPPVSNGIIFNSLDTWIRYYAWLPSGFILWAVNSFHHLFGRRRRRRKREQKEMKFQKDEWRQGRRNSVKTKVKFGCWAQISELEQIFSAEFRGFILAEYFMDMLASS